MPNICLPPKAVDRFKEALKSGEVDPAKLADMSSEERHQFFSKLVGENDAKTVNSLFEEKLLLKNQQKGMITWAKKVAGMSQPARQDMISKIERLDRVLDPEDKEQFLKDLASTKLGVNVTQDEAKAIATLSKRVEEARANMDSGGDRLAFGRAKVALSNYVNELKVAEQKFSLGELKSPAKLAVRAAGNAKAINASMDNSAIFRQGWKTLWTNPRIWQKNARQSFTNLVKQFGGHEVMDELHADIVSRPNYDKMVRAKLAVGNLEEAFPTTAPEKLPVLGRAYKASEAAYTAFVQKTRADVFDKYLEVAQKSGVNINDDKELQAIGKLVNSLTGRGSLGRLEPVGNTVNNVFFSPRFLKSNIDLLTQPLGKGGATSKFAQKQAAKNLLKVVMGTSAVIAIANAVRPGSVELDPRSSDFGKIKVGDTRFDVTGGVGSILTLAARVATQSSKSTTTGQVTKLNSGKYGSQNSLDVVNNFIENKLSPVGSVIKDMLKGQDANGNKVTAGGEVGKLFTPIGLQNFKDMASDPNSANKLLTVIADGLGISANTYKPNSGSSSDWTNNPGKELSAFKQSVGADKFKAANKEYNDKLTQWQKNMSKSPDYRKLTTSAKQSVSDKEKSKIKSDIFKQYDFKYKRAKTNKDQYKQFVQ